MMKRYYRPVYKKAEKESGDKKLVEKRGWPKQIECKVCFKKNVPIEEAILQTGGGTMGHRAYFMCLNHLG